MIAFKDTRVGVFLSAADNQSGTYSTEPMPDKMRILMSGGGGGGGDSGAALTLAIERLVLMSAACTSTSMKSGPSHRHVH